MRWSSGGSARQARVPRPYQPRVESLEQRLALSGIQIIDNGDAGYSTTGSWSRSRGGFEGDVQLTSGGSGADQAQWNFVNLEPGEYRVSATWVAKKNRATNAPFTVLDGAAPLATVAVNQRSRPNDFRDVDAVWEDLGNFTVTGDSLTVRLSDLANGLVCADAVRIELLEPLPPPPPEPPQVTYVGTTAEFRAAVSAATAGSHILVHPGVYDGGNYFANLHGTADRPIVIAAADPTQPPVFRGSGESLKFSDVSYLELRNLIAEGASTNGINIDDGGTFDTPSHHVTLSGLVVRNVGSTGNQDGLKLSGVQDFVLENSTIVSWGAGGSGIDMVGCHRGVISGNTFRHGDVVGANGVQAKGGTTNIQILDNRFEHAGARAIQIGGNTTLSVFRPQPPANYEAKDVTVEGNVIIGSEAAIAFVNIDGAIVRFNTIYRPTKWVLRILQETTSEGFVPSRNGVFTDNIVAFRSDEVQTAVNVGPGTAPETFQFARNWWYCLNDPARSRLSLPTAEVDGTYGIDPLFVNAVAGDLHLQPGSPASHVGAYAPRG